MAYRLKRKSSVQRGVREAAMEQMDKAIAAITDSKTGRHETVHQVRKRCKKLRGLIRLVRPVFDGYSSENACFRNAARDLSFVRDANVMLQTFDDLMEHYDDQLERRQFDRVRAALAQRQEEVLEDDVDLDGRLEAVAQTMRVARHRAADWKIDGKGFEAIAQGLELSYRRGRKALSRAYQEPTTERFHEWRKRAKYHWYHLRLLRGVWPALTAVEGAAADELSGLLGDEHDLAVFRDTLQASDLGEVNPRDIQTLIGLSDQHRAELQSRARPLGRRLYAEKPARLVDRFHRYWVVWRGD